MIDLSAALTGAWAPPQADGKGPALVVWRFDPRTPPPPRSQTRRFIEEMADLGVRRVHFWVPDPQNDQRFLPLAVHAVSFGLKTYLWTEAARLSLGLARVLRGCGFAGVSLPAAGEASERSLSVGLSFELRRRVGLDHDPDDAVEEAAQAGASRLAFLHAGAGAAPSVLRESVDEIFASVWQRGRRGLKTQVFLGGNPCDGAYLALRLALGGVPWAPEAAARLAVSRQAWDSAGMDSAYVDPYGRISAAPGDRVWGSLSEGFRDAWLRGFEPRSLGPKRLSGRCAACRFSPVCGGRRPEGAPAPCYLSDAETRAGFPSERAAAGLA